MNAEKPLKLYDAFIAIALYICVTSLPALPFMEQKAFTCALIALLLPILFYALIRDGFTWTLFVKKGTLLCLPLLLVCFGNLLSLIGKPMATLDQTAFLRQLFFTLATVLAEETIFRVALMGGLRQTRFAKWEIPLSALIFGLCHLTGLFSGAVLPTLAQVGYTAALGLLLAVAYRVGGFSACFLLHFFFNLFQNDLFTLLGGGSWDALFFILNIGLYAFCALYAFFLWWKKIRPNQEAEASSL